MLQMILCNILSGYSYTLPSPLLPPRCCLPAAFPRPTRPPPTPSRPQQASKSHHFLGLPSGCRYLASSSPSVFLRVSWQRAYSSHMYAVLSEGLTCGRQGGRRAGA
jgi:hypothetical protein